MSIWTNDLKCVFWNLLLFLKRKRVSNIYKRKYKHYLMRAKIPSETQTGEENYVKLWSKIDKNVEVFSYRFFHNFMGDVPYIVPESIGHNYIEFFLNPQRFRDYYNDKNIYGKLFDKSDLPVTIIRRMSGGNLIDGNYQVIKNGDSIINFESSVESLSSILLPYGKVLLKPTIDSNSGEGIMIFSKSDGVFKCDNVVLSPHFLKEYGDDFALQEVVEQHKDIAYFNNSSVNTLRLCVYRSVKDENIKLTAAALRIGKNQSIVDNIHSGGRFVKIDLCNGKISEKLYDQFGEYVTKWNGIDFTSNNFQIPCWDSVKKFACKIASENHHCRLLALDVAMTKEGRPILIEQNVIDFSFWIPMYLGYDVFDGETDDVIEYCRNQLKNENVLHIKLI